MKFVLSQKQRGILAGLLIMVFGMFVRFVTGTSSAVADTDKAIPAYFEATTTVVGFVTSSTKDVVTNALVVRVVDGDTIDIRMDGESVEEKVRFLGINTPETVDPRRTVECFGKEASNFMKALLNGKRIRAEGDPEADERDKYQRLLRNIILSDGTDVNASMVGSGYAYAYVSFPQNKTRKKQLVRLQEEAKNAKRGLWADETCAGKK